VEPRQKLSIPEAQLYKAVTDNVREGFNRADALANEKRAGTVGLALTILQRRLQAIEVSVVRDPIPLSFVIDSEAYPT